MSTAVPKRRRRKPPSLRRHQSGQAFVTLNGRNVYLGVHGTPDSQEAYDRTIAEWLRNKRQLPPTPAEAEPFIVSELIAAFWLYAEAHYVGPDGKATSELGNYLHALRPLEKLYGSTPAGEFGPRALQIVREEMIRMKWARKTVNKQVNRLRSVFKWGASQELVSASVHVALTTVSGLQPGRGGAKETEPVKPVPLVYVEAIKPYVSRQVWALVQLQLLSGARAGELVKLRAVDLDTSGSVWTYTPPHHKTAHHGHCRTIPFGPRAQEVIKPFLQRPTHSFLFSPAEAEAERRAARHAQRTTPMSCGNVPGSNVTEEPERSPGEHYDTASYRRAIRRACDRADSWAKGGVVIDNAERIIPRWHPHQLRHATGTAIRRQFGVENSQVILGHRSLNTTAIYAEADEQQARDIMLAVG